MNHDRIRIYRTSAGTVADVGGRYRAVPIASWDDLFGGEMTYGGVARLAAGGAEVSRPQADDLLAPITGQEVWAAGVTYYRSKTARMLESDAAGGGDFYDRVYDAPRPELFFKATSHRVAGPGQAIRIRRDSHWTVPEPELALALDARGRIIGYTIGNDVSARDIEGENPLYLPQAKVYDRSCGLGPGLLLSEDPLPRDTTIHLGIVRDGAVVFDEQTTLAKLKRSVEELVDYLFRDNRFPGGCYLLTGTGIVPPDDFALASGDLVRITIEPIGTLENYVVGHDD